MEMDCFLTKAAAARPQARQQRAGQTAPTTVQGLRRERADTAAYIAELASNLAALAREHRFETLAYVLGMAQLEAECLANEAADARNAQCSR
jgi:hypothetical protein